MRRQAVVLVAGSGLRLRPLTDSSPKCLLEVGGRSILERLLERLAEAGITRAVLVTGYLSERIEEHIAQHKPPFEVSLAPNRDYATTNNVVSLLAARSHLGPGSLVICDGDVVLSGDAIRRLMDEAEPCALLVDQEARLADEEMKVILDARGKVTRLSKTIDPRVAAGESIGIQKIGGPALGRLWPTLDDLVRSGRTDVFYEEGFQRMIDNGTSFSVVPVSSAEWTEIDSYEDFEDACARFAGR